MASHIIRRDLQPMQLALHIQKYHAVNIADIEWPEPTRFVVQLMGITLQEHLLRVPRFRYDDVARLTCQLAEEMAALSDVLALHLGLDDVLIDVSTGRVRLLLRHFVPLPADRDGRDSERAKTLPLGDDIRAFVQQRLHSGELSPDGVAPELREPTAEQLPTVKHQHAFLLGRLVSTMCASIQAKLDTPEFLDVPMQCEPRQDVVRGTFMPGLQTLATKLQSPSTKGRLGCEKVPLLLSRDGARHRELSISGDFWSQPRLPVCVNINTTEDPAMAFLSHAFPSAVQNGCFRACFLLEIAEGVSLQATAVQVLSRAVSRAVGNTPFAFPPGTASAFVKAVGELVVGEVGDTAGCSVASTPTSTTTTPLTSPQPATDTASGAASPSANVDTLSTPSSSTSGGSGCGKVTKLAFLVPLCPARGCVDDTILRMSVRSDCPLSAIPHIAHPSELAFRFLTDANPVLLGLTLTNMSVETAFKGRVRLLDVSFESRIPLETLSQERCKTDVCVCGDDGGHPRAASVASLGSHPSSSSFASWADGGASLLSARYLPPAVAHMHSGGGGGNISGRSSLESGRPPHGDASSGLQMSPAREPSNLLFPPPHHLNPALPHSAGGLTVGNMHATSLAQLLSPTSAGTGGGPAACTGATILGSSAATAPLPTAALMQVYPYAGLGSGVNITPPRPTRVGAFDSDQGWSQQHHHPYSQSQYTSSSHFAVGGSPGLSRSLSQPLPHTHSSLDWGVHYEQGAIGGRNVRSPPGLSLAPPYRSPHELHADNASMHSVGTSGFPATIASGSPAFEISHPNTTSTGHTGSLSFGSHTLPRLVASFSETSPSADPNPNPNPSLTPGETESTSRFILSELHASVGSLQPQQHSSNASGTVSYGGRIDSQYDYLSSPPSPPLPDRVNSWLNTVSTAMNAGGVVRPKAMLATSPTAHRSDSGIAAASTAGSVSTNSGVEDDSYYSSGGTGGSGRRGRGTSGGVSLLGSIGESREPEMGSPELGGSRPASTAAVNPSNTPEAEEIHSGGDPRAPSTTGEGSSGTGSGTGTGTGIESGVGVTAGAGSGRFSSASNTTDESRGAGVRHGAAAVAGYRMPSTTKVILSSSAVDLAAAACGAEDARFVAETITRLRQFGMRIGSSGAHHEVITFELPVVTTSTESLESADSSGGFGGRPPARVTALRDTLREMQDKSHTRDERRLAVLGKIGYLEIAVMALFISTNVSRDELTASFACQTIGNLAMVAPNRARLAVLGAIEGTIAAMGTHAAALRVQKDAVVALRHLAYENDLNKQRIIECGGVHAVVRAMEGCGDGALAVQVQRQCCGALAIFAVHSSLGDLAKRVIIDAGGLHATLRAMNCHITDVQLVVAGLKALGTLVSRSDTRQLAKDAGCIEFCEFLSTQECLNFSREFNEAMRQAMRRLRGTA